jgi:phage terminase large subunit-like protein
MSTKRELLEEQVQVAEALLMKKLGRQMDRYYTDEDRDQYQAHLDIFRAGAEFRERAAFGGNRSGKSHLGSYELSLHLTGQYPDWWKGHRYERPITAWACGTNLDAVRDINQEKLLGAPTALGTGMIPADAIVDKRRKPGVPDLFDTITVKHVSGGISTVQFKPYAAGREAFQGRKIDFIWLDEECDWNVYEECLLRTTSTGEHDPAGKILTTLTPLKGMTEVAEHFLQDGQMIESNDRFASLIAWDDVPHLSGTEKAQLLASIPRHQQEARTKGYPSLGVGAVYQYSEENLTYTNSDLPKHFRQGMPRNFPKGFGMDVGWNATAAVFTVLNPDDGTVYVTDEYKRGEMTPIEHAAVIRLKADTGNGMMMGCIDPASRGRSQKDGTRLLDEYRREGLRLVPAHNAVETGIHRIQTLMDEGRLKIHEKCTGLLAELRQYHRDDKGRIVKRNDHLLDALRYIVLTERAMTRPRPNNFRPKVKTSFGGHAHA